MKHKIQLQCGILHLNIQRADVELDELLNFASRANPKRGFLFVSKVLGKHLPCSPVQMRSSYQSLAQKVGISSKKTLVLGMAETATGLGAGVADSLAQISQNAGQVIYQQTTRHELNIERLLDFDEVHSHAPDQLVYPPSQKLQSDYLQSERLVLVDDEISTGRTLKELALALSTRLSQMSGLSVAHYEVVFVSLVSWLSTEQKQDLQALCPFNIRFESLLEGSFQFEPNPNFKPKLPGQVSACQKAPYVQAHLGRQGMDMMGFSPDFKAQIEIPAHLSKDHPVTVIGTGEFTYIPFLLAEKLHENGFQVSFQSTTRSPILTGHAIQHSLSFLDEQGEGVSNYLHNPPQDGQVIIAYESENCRQNHQLPSLIGQQCLAWVCPL